MTKTLSFKDKILNKLRHTSLVQTLFFQKVFPKVVGGVVEKPSSQLKHLKWHQTVNTTSFKSDS